MSAAIGVLHGVVAAVVSPEPAPSAPLPAGEPLPAPAEPPRDLQRPAAPPRPTAKDITPSGRPMPSAISAQFEPKYDPVSLQLALRRELGVDLGADGVIGPASRRAIADWQLRIGSNPTGFLSVSQWYRLKGPVE